MTMMPVVLFVPLFGSLSVMLGDHLERTGKMGDSKDGLEVMKESLVDMQEMPVHEDEGGGSVPLQDALLIDNAKMKRSVILDVLMQDTESFVKSLNEARMNEDVEVVHYATTAMVELSKEYELRLQKYASMYAEAPLDEELLREYKNYIARYIASGLVDGQMLEIHRNTYRQLLMDSIKKSGRKEDYLAYIECLFESRDFSGIRRYLSVLEKNWPTDEKLWEYKFRLAYENRDRQEMNRLMEETGKEGRFYSRSIRKIVEFWEEKTNA